MPETRIHIKSFDPICVELPNVKAFIGEVRIVLPDVHVAIYDLSLGGALPGAHIGGDMSIAGFTMQLGEPGMKPIEMFAFLMGAMNELKKMWQIYQDEFSKRGALRS